MSYAAAALTIVQTAAVLKELVNQYNRGEITQEQLVTRWETMKTSLEATNAAWDRMEAEESDIGTNDTVGT